MPRRSLATCVALAVGEGAADALFLRHVKELYLPRWCGTTLRIYAGMGKGGRAVLKDAISRRNAAADGYTLTLAMLDADTDWGAEERELAVEEKITVIASAPCLEATLLDIVGANGERNTRECKREFARRFGCEAHQADQVLRAQFGRDVLDAARSRVELLDILLQALRI